MPASAALVFAVAAPTLLAFNVSPSATLLNQLLAVAGWGLVLLLLPTEARRQRGGGAWPLQAVLVVLGLAVLASCSAGLPSSMGLAAGGVLLAALAVMSAAHGLSDGRVRGSATAAGAASPWPIAAFFAGVLLAGVASALIGGVQVFFPAWADGEFIARSGLVGRAVGNLRQPNHLSSLLVWALIALVPLAQAGRLLWLRFALPAALGVGALLVLGVVLTASRTGVLGVVLLALWGLLDRRLGKGVRVAMCAAPVLYGLGWMVVAGWAHETAHTFGGEVRLGEGDLSASRFGIWANTLALIRANPLAGVGFGEFNFAWTLSEFPQRPVAFFDHTHNLPLQFAVELGLPLAGLLMALLIWSLWLAGRRSWQGQGDAGAASRAAFMMVLLIGLHSLLEYPLWYAYFLLPTAWAWGWALRRPPEASQPRVMAESHWLGRVAGALMLAGAAFAVYDYSKAVAIFAPGKTAAPLPERILRGQNSWLFSHQADYAAATTTEPPSRAMAAFGSTTHALLDTRLMMDWARALSESGHADKASYLAARLREFRNPAAAAFFAACDPPPAPGAAPPFQCVPPTTRLGWRDFLN
ncbi:MAG TPA: Wzy polymerase domain-containing protein [Ideonella sp.]|nr:Wzy polymerase domain-containing protein [Ideonella sp.]